MGKDGRTFIWASNLHPDKTSNEPPAFQVALFMDKILRTRTGKTWGHW